MAGDEVKRCCICDAIMNVPGNPLTRDCGGDCLKCLALAGDPDCIAEVVRLAATAHIEPTKED